MNGFVRKSNDGLHPPTPTHTKILSQKKCYPPFSAFTLVCLLKRAQFSSGKESSFTPERGAAGQGPQTSPTRTGRGGPADPSRAFARRSRLNPDRRILSTPPRPTDSAEGHILLYRVIECLSQNLSNPTPIIDVFPQQNNLSFFTINQPKSFFGFQGQ